MSTYVLNKQDGWRTAKQRDKSLRQVMIKARAGLRNEQEAKAAREEEEIRRMLEGMAIKRAQDEEEDQRKFREREQQLWAVSFRSSFEHKA